MTGVLTFAASLRHLTDTPRLYGWTWDLQLGGDFGDPLQEEGVELLRTDPDVRAASTGADLNLTVDGESVLVRGMDPVVGSRAGRRFWRAAPPRTSMKSSWAGSRRPIAASARPCGRSYAGQERELEVVGRAVLPEIRALTTFTTLQALAPDAPPLIAVVDLANGADPAAFADQALEAFGFTDEELVTPELPPDLSNFGRADATPMVFGVLMAGVAVATLVHMLATLVRRRRRDLAILRTLGFARGQVLATVTWQGSILVISAAAARHTARRGRRTIGLVRGGRRARGHRRGRDPRGRHPARGARCPRRGHGGRASSPAYAATRTDPSTALRSE